MNTINLLLTFSAVLTAGLIVYYQYFFKQKISRFSGVLALLRFISILGVLILLINPKFEQRITEVIKPKLLMASDNSASISHLGSAEQMINLRDQFIRDDELNDRFDISDFVFGSVLETDSLLDFEEQQTNINSTVESLDAFADKNKAAIILPTDGHQTFGKNYAYLKTNNPVYPIVVGDTIEKPDINISRINVNAYVTLENNFEVEIFLNSNVYEDTESRLIVEKGGTEMFSTKVSFSKEERSKLINFYLPADSIGMQLYRASLLPFKNEADTKNNLRNFGIEVLNEQSEVAIIYGVLHPDLGMIKRSIESNKQRKASLIHINDFKGVDNRFTMYVLYQPNSLFKELFADIEKREFNYMLVTGLNTDWGFINSLNAGFYKEVTGETEAYFPSYRNDFSGFYTDEIDFESFPPLNAQFGNINFSVEHDIMLNQIVNNVKINNPLLATFESNSLKRVVIFGENIWQWRAHSYSLYDSFDKFDLFFNSLIQFLQFSDRKKNIDLFYKPIYHARESIKIQVKKYDSNLRIDLNSQLVLQLNDSTDEIPFYPKKNYYEAQIKSLEQGTYRFNVKDLDTGESRKGSFIVEIYSLEEVHNSANNRDLHLLAQNTGGTLFYQDQFLEVKSELLQNPEFRPVQIQGNKLISLIDWRWLLGLIVLSLSLEWFLRKHRGLI